VFVGLAPTTAVSAYLARVGHSVVTDTVGDNGDPVTTYLRGGAPRLDPGQATRWTASASGARTQSLTWEPRSGDWTLVVMNADGSAPVAADVAVGAEVPVLGDVAVGLLVSGSVLLVVALVLLVAALRHEPVVR
jgi:hypothetical protein